ncbi:citrate lyase subunit beta/citryl-CoA lyase/(S)-citramalyl-CoA lyase [Rhizobium sp. BK650]|uniref:HpcH/HpaI aldolase/citrate lyase family protein n=1 Tax=Rhizobium sp. BK650 TaxID=2586990 RepID=UPI00161F45F2|nr:aldolase/citrate lyase family protein [Rhizobium sp. BK650]MBB3660997.1 citrate lyase subunit beta/citryl-CoA lyase/(S)-citramalyl-CoA lyase [Rhizobium sp. BK650]
MKYCYLNTSVLKFDETGADPGFGCDAVILDLEDAVHIRDKNHAREKLENIDLSQFSKSGLQFGVRINSPRTSEGLEDLRTILRRAEAGRGGVQFIQIPKIEATSDVEICRTVLGDLLGGVDVIPIVETPTGVERVEEIARISDAMMFGRVDLSASLYRPNPSYLSYARGKFCAACAANGIAAIDTANFTTRSEILDLVAFEKDCQQGFQEGFTAKAVVHPSQIAIVKRVFTIGGDQLDQYRKIVTLYSAASEGFTIVGDQVIAPPFVGHAKMMLHLHRE